MFFHRIRKARVVLPLLAVLASGQSLAQTNTATGTSTGLTTEKLTSADFSLYLERYSSGSNSWIQMNDTEVKYFFNRARCECGNSEVDTDDQHKYSQFFKVAVVPAANTTTKISRILQNSASGYSGNCRLYGSATGTSCLDVNSTSSVVLPNVCTNLLTPNTYEYQFGDLTSFSRMSGTRLEIGPIPVSTLFGATLTPRTCGATQTCNAPGNCAIARSSATIYFWAQSVSGISPDMNDELMSVNIVGAAPNAPIFNDDPNATPPVQGGNEALTVNWDWPSGFAPSNQNTSFLGLQVFCKRGADTPVFPKGSFGRSYSTARDLCPSANPDMSSYGEFHGLDPIYLCSGLLQPNTKSYRISGLQNGIYYGVGVASIDRYGNISPITDVRYGKPIPTVDFYTEYREAGGNAEGGFCSVAGWRGRPGVMALAGLGLLGLLLVRRWRKGPPGGTALVVLVATGALLAGQGRAQAITYDDMDISPDEDEKYIPPEPPEPPPPKPPSSWTPSDRDFALEFRFGLYMPDVDSELQSSAPRPNALMFGNSRRPMWQVEFDWEILQRFGTLAVGASVGYWKENGKACYRVPLEASGWRTCNSADRSGDNTSLRLIPFAALLVYRMDEAAKRWGIPIVPYGKIGLNYTIWTVNNGDGRVPSYKGGRGQGGTPGWQAAVGLALQLDFIDAAAAREFDSDSGVNHTYVFFEVDHVDGSGLHRNNVLRVGDNTWFAGLMFEF